MPSVYSYNVLFQIATILVYSAALTFPSPIDTSLSHCAGFTGPTETLPFFIMYISDNTLSSFSLGLSTGFSNFRTAFTFTMNHVGESSFERPSK